MRDLINVLAGYRILRLIQIDSIFVPAREWLFRFFGRKRLRSLRKLLDCPWCLGFWVACGVVFADAFMGDFWRISSEILAASALIGFLGWLDHKHIG